MRFNGIMVVVSLIIAFFTLCWEIFIWVFPISQLEPKPEYFHLIANSTTSIQDAKRIAVSYKIKGYDCAVYLSPNGYYAVTLGLYLGEQAVETKKGAIEKGLIGKDAYIVSKNKLIAKIEFQEFKEKVYIQVGAFIKKKGALSRVYSLIDDGFDSKIYLGNTGMFIVILGEFQESQARRLRYNAIESGYIKKDSIITKGKNYLHPIEVKLLNRKFQ